MGSSGLNSPWPCCAEEKRTWVSKLAYTWKKILFHVALWLPYFWGLAQTPEVSFIHKEFYFCRMSLWWVQTELLHCWSNNSLLPICCLRLAGKYPLKSMSLPLCSGAKSINYSRVGGYWSMRGVLGSESGNVNHKKGSLIKGLMCSMHFTPCPALACSPEGCIFTICKVFVLSWACSCSQGRTWALATFPDF